MENCDYFGSGFSPLWTLLKNRAFIGRSFIEGFAPNPSQPSLIREGAKVPRHPEFTSFCRNLLISCKMGPLGVISGSHGTINTCMDINPDLHNLFAQQTVKDISPFTSHFSRKRTAFTLAEVLITLGIIGVVAALTMPVLMAQHRKQVIETRLAKFYSAVNQAVKMSEVDNGSILFWDKIETENNEEYNRYVSLNTLSWYKKYLAKYLTSVKVEETDTLEKSLAVYFSDGSLVLISDSSWLFYPNAKDFKKVSDDKGTINRDTSVCGKKYFTFYFKSGYCPEKGLIAYAQCNPNMTEDTIKNHFELGCKESVTNERAYCTLLIAKNGWKIPKDYPIKL